MSSGATVARPAPPRKTSATTALTSQAGRRRRPAAPKPQARPAESRPGRRAHGEQAGLRGRAPVARRASAGRARP